MTVSTITPEQQQKIADLLSTMILPAGLGNEENACSIAAINLALTGELTDEIPDCMSEVIGEFIIVAQDSMPSEVRNSAEWKRLLPLAAGTGRKCESERLALVVQWVWETVLPTIQPFADENGFGSEWRVMLQQRTANAATAAAVASSASGVASHAAARAAAAATFVGYLAGEELASADAYFTTKTAHAANAAAHAAAATHADAWQQFNPCGLLEQLIAVN